MVKKKRSKGSSYSSSTRKPKLSSTSSSELKNPHPDLISDLPDSLLLHILSLLDTREVIQTCLLSRRWRYLWRSIPCLTLWDSRRHTANYIDTANYVDKCLFHHHQDSKVQKLHIAFNYEEDKQHALLVDSWFHFAIKCKVEDFHLDLFNPKWYDVIQYDQVYKLPHSFYLCTTLTSLYLRGCNLNLPDSNFQLGSLKKLTLWKIELNPDSIEHLSSNCPLLEDIIVSHCNNESDLNIVIINEHVKRLKISWHGQDEYPNLNINAPTLLSLVIDNCYPAARFHIQNLASLMSVDVIGDENLFTYELDNHINCFEELLYDLRHVKHLKLCGRCVQVLSLMELMSLEVLSISATCLELEVSLKKWEFPGIRYLLENCSNLEKLKMVDRLCCDEISFIDEIIENYDFEEEEYWESFEIDSPSIMQNIKIIEIDLKDKIRHEEFVRFLLKNAKNLESIVINTPKRYANPYNYERLFKLSQRLHTFPRSSPNAKLFIT